VHNIIERSKSIGYTVMHVHKTVLCSIMFILLYTCTILAFTLFPTIIIILCIAYGIDRFKYYVM